MPEPTYHGTIIGGAHDGEIYIADRTPVVIDDSGEADPSEMFTARAIDPYVGDSRVLNTYHFVVDDDGRGWWRRLQDAVRADEQRLGPGWWLNA